MADCGSIARSLVFLLAKESKQCDYNLTSAIKDLVNFNFILFLVCHMRKQMCHDISCSHKKYIAYTLVNITYASICLIISPLWNIYFKCLHLHHATAVSCN